MNSRTRDRKTFVVAHAPYWHDGNTVSKRHRHIMLAALPAVLMGVSQYGAPALGVVTFSIGCAMLWELVMNLIIGKRVALGDGSAALTGLLLGMLLPATAPWWLIVLGTFLAIVVGKQIFGGLGLNPLNPPLLALAMLLISFKGVFDFNEALLNYDLGFPMTYPLADAKFFGVQALERFSLGGLLMGHQAGAVGSTFGLGLIIGGVYLMLRGFVRWEISLSFLVGVFVTAMLFHLGDSAKYAGPFFHLLTGYTLIGAFFLLPEDSSSPVNCLPMFIFGVLAGVMTVLIRNIGAYVDGIPFSILLLNLANPLLDKIRPRAIGKVVENA
ncbi:MAG: RnfABCDGE type electron transport complex subunit D [Deltaproteobacteria bacterium]|nr:RnfABCDGE type electron transport complex subunit D [Deltaproteobacteria bacterium]